MTWRVESDGYQIFFNRDERHEREPAAPPAVFSRGNRRYIAPLDGDHGGTWIAVNDAGLGLCLLNGFPAFPAGDIDERHGYTSRGGIPLLAVECETVEQVDRTIGGSDLSPYRPFILVAIQPGGEGLQLRWSGRAMERLPVPARDRPLVSSSFCTEEVRRNREAVHARLIGGGAGAATERHLAFHSSHDPQAGPHSPCMHRDDARTVSFTRIEVRGSEVLCHYAPDSPCRGLPAAPAARIARDQ